MAKSIMLNSVGTRTQPCLTLLATGKASEGSLLSWTQAIMELADNCDELGSKFFHAESILTDCIIVLGQINEGQVEVTVLFHAFLLELTGGKDHVSGSSTCAEATLALGVKTLF